MKAADLRELPYEELQEKLADAKEELFNLRFQFVTNQLDNTARLRTLRREVAQLATVLREQEIEAWQKQQEDADG